jgi:mannose-1-phosphate guanylyltransferase/mannose-6-phosphate isomerase
MTGGHAVLKIRPVVLCGGAGTRLFPISRAQWPKQFLALTSDRSLLQETVLRVAPTLHAAGLEFLAPIIVANGDHRFAVAAHLREVSITPAGLLLEPEARNTAGAIACAAAFAQSLGDGRDTLLLVLPSDHAIGNLAAFHQAIARAGAALGASDLLATFGIDPTGPETGYGYIERGAVIAGADQVHHIARFREKPDRAAAESYLASGRYVWNSGMFLFSADALLAEMTRHAPDIAKAAIEAVANAAHDLDFVRLDPNAFATMPSISIDYAVMERTDRAIVASCSIGWSDVGSFKAVWEVAPKDQDGNALHGDVWVKDTHDSLIQSTGNQLIATIGVEQLAIIATDDVVLVTQRARAEEVKDLVASLNNQGRSEPRAHRKVFRPWGSYEQISMGPTYQVKRIVINAGASISLQKHHKRSEHWVIVEGIASVHLDGQERDLHPNESIYIPMGSIHRLSNNGDKPLVVIEVQSGSYLGEDDIVRLEDIYGRSKANNA